ncbi:MAG: hypothetical protein AAGJ85_08390 [Pseudomonadota bacterium]
MRRIFVGVAAAATLTACGGTSPEAELRAACDVVVADPEGQEAMADMNADADSFCTCLNTNVLALSEDDQAKVRATLKYVADKSQETGQGVEDVAGALIRDGMMAPDDEELQAVIEGVPMVGEVFDEIEENFEDGTCKRAA